jgi:hypothetical protein
MPNVSVGLVLLGTSGARLCLYVMAGGASVEAYSSASGCPFSKVVRCCCCCCCCGIRLSL